MQLNKIVCYRAVVKEGAGRRHSPLPPPPPHFQEQNFFFHVKLGNIKSLYVNNMWDYILFIEQDSSDKK